MNDREIRTIDNNLAEVRSVGSSRNVEGYGIIFNSESKDLGGLTEIILPSAMDGIIEQSDIFALMNHDINRGVLARSTNGRGSLRLTIDNKGVKYAFEAPSFDLGNELVEGVRRGDIKASSFAFSVVNERQNAPIVRREDGSYLRIVKRFDKIYDMSPCYREAYQDTTVALRSLDEFKSTTEDLTNVIDTNPVIANTIIETIVEVPTVKRTLSEKERDLKRRNYVLKYNKK